MKEKFSITVETLHAVGNCTLDNVSTDINDLVRGFIISLGVHVMYLCIIIAVGLNLKLTYVRLMIFCELHM